MMLVCLMLLAAPVVQTLVLLLLLLLVVVVVLRPALPQVLEVSRAWVCLHYSRPLYGAAAPGHPGPPARQLTASSMQTQQSVLLAELPMPHQPE
jgi:hypothetical protein